ncbi:Pol Polyprotein [Phytophthora palmivora]|uniref:Pol Polyprotein n=1 Tax=Phytophthora palmivora TaxID=4796 RepID=A0A2P4Y8A1_9STRA|nr:Pol Polyprotein [Phytophthora palmivora]
MSNSTSGCTLYNALDLVDRYYQILLRESDISLTAASTPSGMLWEWLAMPEGLPNALTTFNRLVIQLFRPLRTFAQTYFDDIFVHSRAEGGQTAMEMHLKHIRRIYTNIDKRVFAAEEIKVLGCFVRTVGVRADPGRIKAIAVWSTPRSQKDLRKWLGLANYLHKYSTGYAELARPLSDLLTFSRVGVRADPGKVNAIAAWPTPRSQKDLRKWLGLANYLHKYSTGIKASLLHAPVLALSDDNKSFSDVCDASDYAIGCSLLQKDDEGRERVISFQSRQFKTAERNYPVMTRSYLK